MKNRKKRTRALSILGMGILLLLCAGCGKNKDAAPDKAEAPSGETTAPLEEPAPEKKAYLSELNIMDIMCAPTGIVATQDGAFLVTDTYNKRLWQIKGESSEAYAGAETVVDLYGEPMGGYNDAKRLSSYFGSPWDMAEFLGGWAVSDTVNNVVRIVRDEDVETLKGETDANPSGTGFTFSRPTGLASDDKGNLYVADTGNGAVRKVSPNGVVTTEAEGLEEPMGLCWKDGVLYIAETGANRIVKVENGLVQTVAGNGEEEMTDGAADQAAFAAPRDIAVDSDGTVYVADTLNCAIRRIKDGQVDTVASRDLTDTGFGLTSPTGLLLQEDSLYICDDFSRKVFVIEWK